MNFMFNILRNFIHQWFYCFNKERSPISNLPSASSMMEPKIMLCEIKVTLECNACRNSKGIYRINIAGLKDAFTPNSACFQYTVCNN